MRLVAIGAALAGIFGYAMGYSIGTWIAAEAALELPPRALVLVAPYASLPHVIAARMP